MDPRGSKWYPYIMRNNSNLPAQDHYSRTGLPTMDYVALCNRLTQDSYGQIGLPRYSPQVVGNYVHAHSSNEFTNRHVNSSLNAYGLLRYSPYSKVVKNHVHGNRNNEFKERPVIASDLNASGLPKSSPNLEVVGNHVHGNNNNEFKERHVIASDLNASGLPKSSPNSDVVDNHVDISKPQIESLKPSGGVKKNRITWTEEEHRNFLLGLQKYGKGNWKAIAEKCVVTKTYTQVASHAQKYFERQKKTQENPNKKLRVSIHDTPIPEISTTMEYDNSLVLNESHIMPLEQHQQTIDQHIHAPPMTFNPDLDDTALMMDEEDFMRIIDDETITNVSFLQV